MIEQTQPDAAEPAAPPQQGLIEGAAGPTPTRPIEPLPEAKSLLAEPEEGEGAAEAPLSEDEVQESYEMAVAMMSKVIYSKGGVDRLLRYFKSPVGTVQDKIIETVKNMVVELDKRVDLPEEVIVPAALEVLGEVIEVCVKARLMRDDPKVAEAMGSMLTAVLFDEYGVTEEQANEARAGFEGAETGETDPMAADESETAMPGEELPAAGPKPLIASEMSA